MLTIAIVEDDDGVRVAYADLMSSYGYEVRAFGSAEDFVASNCQNEVECLILDQRLPGLSGLELQAQLKRQHCALPIVFVTSQDDDVTRAKALDSGAVHFLNKPIDADELVRCVIDAQTRGASEAP
ncbi:MULTISPECIES: response regulator transcription factor [Rhizobium]|uniref:FixJ family two-component response regulator n=1 Tax=Rhizobium wenxiniae TaxID=1737357 RepID=A0A7W9Y7W7_9HYPH|nr:response regulator [Rhizobium wenxiniae]MBB6163619.1 FixJ family two-component response regulator [Rhizobium wenxiniae]GGG11748.1 response regulator [Rhizobium wenxiniae]